MKNLITLFCLAYFITGSNTLIAQETSVTSEEITNDYLERSPIYDYSEIQLNNTDTIPGFQTKPNKLKISGIIYNNDGTPAKDIILYISQTDENGDYEVKENNQKEYIHNSGWVKTNADGQYTLYTYVPGRYEPHTSLKRIKPVVKEPGKPEYKIASFVFNDDPLLTKRCRKKIAKVDANSILDLKEKDGMFIATRDIVLN